MNAPLAARAATALALALALGACATAAPQDASGAPVRYACDEGKSFTASYAASGRRADVSAGGRIYVLPQVGASARYVDHGVELQADGSGAQLQGARGAPYRNCRTG